MSERVARLRRARYGQRPNDREVYHRIVGEQVEANFRVVDIGCGRGREDRARWDDLPPVELIGLDRDPAAAAHPDLSSFRLLSDVPPWPVASASADLMISRYVLEHADDPSIFFGEVARILKRGGRFVFLTPNRYYPPMIVSQLLPHAAKQRLLAWTGHSASEDVFPTYYRANSGRRLRRLAAASGLRVEHLSIREYAPTRYLDFFLPGFVAACAYHEVIKRLRLDRVVGASIIGILRRD